MDGIQLRKVHLQAFRFLHSPLWLINSKQIVEDWKIGWRVSKESENMVKRDEIALLYGS